ncbi:MAG: hypothetical protein Q8898_02030 [Bacillota bacterium]|nr:hypothetical protein [Bacillota bacterium]
MEGLTFYWVSWFFWVYLTFFARKDSKYRTKMAAAILFTIILSSYHFTVLGIQIGVGGIFAICFSYSFLSGEKKRVIFYFFICNYIITVVYATFQMFGIFDPVLFIVKKEWMMAISLAYIAIILQNTFKGRLMLLISGTMQGEILYAFIVSKYSFSYMAGSFAYLDVCTLSSVLVIAWSVLENARTFFESHFNFSAKEKQNSS